MVATDLQPLRVIVDSRLQTPASARMLAPPGQVLIYAAEPAPERQAELERRGAEVAYAPGPNGKVDLPALLADLARRGVNELHVEAGHKLNGSFVRERLVDEYLVYMAPKLLGMGRELAAFGPLAGLDEAVALRFVSVANVGDDLRIVARADSPDSRLQPQRLRFGDAIRDVLKEVPEGLGLERDQAGMADTRDGIR